MKQNEENHSKKPRPNKYQIAAKIGKATKTYVVPIASFVVGSILTVVAKDKISRKK